MDEDAARAMKSDEAKLRGAETVEQPKVYVIILNWNNWAATVHCLESLTLLEYPNYRVLVVDNGSEDSSVERIRAAYPDVEILETGANLGYAGGNNVGIRHALRDQADAVWILNNDTFVDRDALTELVSALRGYGALVSRQLKVDEPGDWNVAFAIEEDVHKPIACEGCERGVHAADLIVGGSLILDRAALDQVGLFDESYFHYYEEVDLVERLRRSGWARGLACRARVRHVHRDSATTSPELHYYFIRNRLLYRRKLHDQHPARILAQRTELGRALQLRRSLQTRSPGYFMAGIAAIVDALRGKTGPRDGAHAGRLRRARLSDSAS